MSNPEDQRPGVTPPSPFDRPAPPPGSAAPPPPPPPVGAGVPPAPAYGQPPAPPQYGQPPSAPPPPGYPQPPAPPYGAPPSPGYTPYGVTAPGAKPPRPAVTIAAILLLVGSALMVVGSLLPFLEANGESINGFDERWFDEDPTGPVYVFFAVVFAGFAITFLAARRVFAVAVIAVVLAALAVLVTFGDFGNLSDLRDLLNSGGDDDVSFGAGLPVVILGALVTLGGSIAALAKRRR
jgi:hypothetical protein